MKTLLSSVWVLCMLGAVALQAQSPVSTFFQGQGRFTAAVSYAYEQYDQVLLVPADINGVPVFNEVALNSVSIYGTVGLSDKWDLVVGLPYIQAEGQASEGVLKELGYTNTQKGIQDISLYAKYRPVSFDLGAANLAFMLGAGVQTPLGDYRVDQGLQSIIAIGNRATSLTGIGGAHLQTQSGLFLSTQIGYSLRDDRVPDALIGEIKVGYAGSKFYADAWLAGQRSDGGTNILAEGFDGFFPATDVTYQRAGVQVFLPVAAGFGISGGINTILNGRNIGDATGYSVGVVFQAGK